MATRLYGTHSSIGKTATIKQCQQDHDQDVACGEEFGGDAARLHVVHVMRGMQVLQQQSSPALHHRTGTAVYITVLIVLELTLAQTSPWQIDYTMPTTLNR